MKTTQAVPHSVAAQDARASSILEGLTERNAAYAPRLTPLPERAYREIKSLVLGNKLRGGEYVLEEDLASAVGMSRTPLRAALVQLQNENLITIVPRRGIRIVPITRSDIREIYTILECLEAEAARALAQREDRAALVRDLMAIVSKMRKALTAGDLAAWDRASDQFHKQLIASSGNERLSKLCANLLDQSQRVRSFTLHVRQLPVRATDAQAAMLRAINAGDAERAASIQIAHKRAWRDELEHILTRLQLEYV